jgi:hypothetical protein
VVQFLRLGAPGLERPAVRDNDGVLYDLSPVTADISHAVRRNGWPHFIPFGSLC